MYLDLRRMAIRIVQLHLYKVYVTVEFPRIHGSNMLICN